MSLRNSFFRRCRYACTRKIQILNDHEISPNAGYATNRYTNIDGYRYVNLFVVFSQETLNEEPVNLRVLFAFDELGKMGSAYYVNLEEIVDEPQGVKSVMVSGENTWHGNPHNKSSYIVRLPVMGPFIQVVIYNKEDIERRVSVWAYLVS